MTDKKQQTGAGKVELAEDELKKVQGGWDIKNAWPFDWTQPKESKKAT